MLATVPFRPSVKLSHAGDVRIEVRIEALFERKIPPRVRYVCTTFGGIADFIIRSKFWGFLGDFYEKSPKWVWATPTTFEQVRTASATFHTTRTNLTPLISRMRAMAASEGAGAASMTV